MTEVFDLSSTSPAAASTAAGLGCSGLAKFLAIRVDAVLIGATGGALDVYIQRKIAPNTWVDWAHFPQLAAAASAVAYSLIVQAANVGTPLTGSASQTIASIATAGTDATPVPALAAATLTLNHPGDMIRVVYVAGASTSAGGAQKIYVTGIGPSR